MGERIVVVSGRGGAGKTVVTANLGTALARRGQKVLLIDADTGMRCLDIALGMENSIVYDSVDVLEGTCKLRQALLRDKLRPGLTLLAAAQTRPRAALTPEGLRGMTTRLKDKFDFIIIDAPAGTEQGFDSACAGADRALMVLSPDPPGVRSAQRLVGLLEQRSLLGPLLAFNRVRPELIRTGLLEPVEKAQDALRLDTLALLPEDAAVAESCFTGRPLDAHCASGLAYDAMARRLLGEEVPLELPDVRPELPARIRQSLRVLRGVRVPDPEE